MEPFNQGMKPKVGAKFQKQSTKLFQEKKADSDDDEEEEEAHLEDYFWKPSITSGSLFIAGTMEPREDVYSLRDHVGEEDTMVV